MPAWQTAALPADGVWRVGRGDDPLRPPPRGGADLGDTRAGNRFDSLTGSYGVLYFGSTLQACLGETLGRYRSDPKLTFIEDEWARRNFMARGSVPQDWRIRRTAVRVTVQTARAFLDVEGLRTRRALQAVLGPVLKMFDVDDLDVGAIRGRDRRVTRLVSEWAWRESDADGRPLFAGIRYLSRIETAWECWAVFDDEEIVELERHPILRTTPELVEVAECYGLTVF